MKTFKYTMIVALALSMVNCSSIRRKFHYFMDMAYAPSVDTQQIDDIGNRVGNMIPPDNTISYKSTIKRFNRTVDGKYVVADQELYLEISGVNSDDYPPKAPDSHAYSARFINSPFKSNDAQMLVRGEDRFNIYCAPCHGLTGRGDGPVKEKFELIKPVVRVEKGQSVPPEAWGPEQLFMLITNGKGMMRGYASQVPELDRWAIAHYVKKLQADARK